MLKSQNDITEGTLDDLVFQDIDITLEKREMRKMNRNQGQEDYRMSRQQQGYGDRRFNNLSNNRFSSNAPKPQYRSGEERFRGKIQQEE